MTNNDRFPSSIKNLLRLSRTLLLLASASFVFCQASAQVALPFYDPFPTTYGDGTSLGSGTSATTWSIGNSVGSGGLTNRNSAALSYSGLAASSGLGVVIPAPGGSSRSKGVQINPGTFSAANPTLYASFLLNIQTPPSAVRTFVYLRNSTGSGTPHLGIFITPTNTLLISKNSTTPAAGFSAALPTGSTHLVVVRYKFNPASGDDEVALWLDPGSLGVPEINVPGSTLSTTTGTDVTTLLGFTFQQTTSDTGVYWVDEVRIGLTWADVTPNGCTQPTAYAVTGGGAYCSGGSGVSVGLANSDSGINYQLKLNGTNFGSPVTGTGANLDFGLQTTAGTYTVSGSNNTTACVGAMTGNAVVTVSTAPSISGGPSNSVVCSGTTANFTVTASGTSLTYQWQANTGSGFNNVSTGTGGTSSSYTTATLSPADDGTQYRCLVSGTCPPSATSGTATVSVSSGVSITSTPLNTTVSVGSTPTFTLGASGPGLTYQWQFSTDNAVTWNNVTTGSGGTTTAYTTAPLALTDSGTEFQCIVNASCGSPSNAGPATVTVKDAVYRSLASGPWNLLGTWEQSYDSGFSWAPATTSPNAANTTSITVRNGHTVTVTNAQTVDDLTIQAGGEVDASGATLTIADGAATTDCDVFGTLQVASTGSSGLSVTAGAGVNFENGGHFIWNNSATVAVPTATWSDGSLCEIQNGSSTTPTGLSQSFYDFYWNKSSAAAVNLGGTLTTIRNNLRMRGSSDSANSVRFTAVTSTVDLRVGRDVVLEGGFTTLSGGSQVNTILNIWVGQNFIINPGASLDSRTSGAGSSANILFTNISSSQVFSNVGAITHTGSGGGCPINWNIGTNVTVNMAAGNIAMFSANGGARDSVTVDGTLIMGTNLITGAGNLFLDPTGTLSGNGTNQLTIGLTNTVYGGTLNLGTVPTLSAGDSFKLFDSLAYDGAFASIIPSAPPGGSLLWDATTLTVNGTLTAANPGSGPATNPTNIVISVIGNNATIIWPPNHIGWTLETQTNSLLGAWSTVPGSTTTNEMIIPIDPHVPDVFYRLRLTIP